MMTASLLYRLYHVNKITLLKKFHGVGHATLSAFVMITFIGNLLYISYDILNSSIYNKFINSSIDQKILEADEILNAY